MIVRLAKARRVPTDEMLGVKPPSKNGATVSRRILRRPQATDGSGCAIPNDRCLPPGDEGELTGKAAQRAKRDSWLRNPERDQDPRLGEPKVAKQIGEPLPRETLRVLVRHAQAHFDLTPDARAERGLRPGARLAELAVSIPHKLNVMQYWDEIDEAARVIGVVNAAALGISPRQEYGLPTGNRDSLPGTASVRPMR